MLLDLLIELFLATTGIIVSCRLTHLRLVYQSAYVPLKRR